MTNDELDRLEKLARDVAANLPDLAMKGDGQFYKGADHVTPSGVLAYLYNARTSAFELAERLRAMPRRKVSAGKGAA